MKVPRIALVVAVADNGVIGRDGKLPWRIPEDMQGDYLVANVIGFKAKTMGKPVVMGRKTWESLPKRPLPGRTNIVVTRDPDYAAEGAAVAHSVDDAILAASREGTEEIAIIGGADIFKAALPRADRIYLTEVYGVVPGDVNFPSFNRARWRETFRERHEASTDGGFAFSFVVLDLQTQ